MDWTDWTGCASASGREGFTDPTSCLFPPVLFISLCRPQSLSVSPPVISLSPGGSVAPPMIVN